MNEPPAPPAGQVGPVPAPSLRQLASLLNRLPALFWATGVDLTLTSVAGGALQGAQAEAGYFTGLPLGSLFETPDTISLALTAHREALRGERRSFTVDYNGRELQAFVEPLRDAAGRIAGTVGLAIDSTERLVAERALRISEHSYRLLIEESPSAVFRSTMSGQLLQVNRAMLEMLGYDAAGGSELLMRDLPQVFSPADRFDEFRQAILSQPVVQSFEAVWLRRDGREIHVSLSSRATRDAGGDAWYLDALATDVTERKLLEAQLSHAQRMQLVGQLAGGVAHDFNNLLTIIGGHLQLMSEDHPEIEHRLIPVMGAAERAGILTRQLLAFSRRQVMKSEVIGINEVVSRFVGLLSPLIRKTISLSYSPGPDAGFVRADSRQVEQVLMNLAINAQDAMPEGGELSIETARVRVETPLTGPDPLPVGDYVRITVRDTGHGMDAETRSRIFEPFFTTKGVGAGTGLGLSMTYGIVRQSGGHIAVESAPRAGSTFIVHLPRVAESHSAEKVISVAPAAPPKGRKTILVAEDEAAVRELVCAYLGSQGYKVLSAPDGREAIQVARQHQGELDVLLSDMVMPHVGGRELATAVLQLFPAARVVFMSGYGGTEAGALELESPGADFLAKPFSMNALAKAIRQALETPAGNGAVQ